MPDQSPLTTHDKYTQRAVRRTGSARVIEWRTVYRKAPRAFTVIEWRTGEERKRSDVLCRFDVSR